MKKSVKLVSTFVAITEFVAMSVVAAKGVALHLNLKKGENYTVTTKQNQNVVMTVQGQSMTQGVSSEMIGSLNVSDDNTVVSKWESFTAKVSMMGTELEYDSKHPEKTNPMMKEQMKQYEDMLKDEAVYSYNANGEMTSKKENDLPVGPANSIIRELPKDELTAGYTWEKEDKQEAQGITVKTVIKYTVKEVNKKFAVVDYAASGTTEEGSISYTGTLNFDIAKGIVVKDNMKTEITATLSEQGLVIPVKINGTSVTTVK